MFTKKEYKDFDRTLVLIVLLIFIIGCLAIYSAQQAKGLAFDKSFLLKQIIWLAIGSLVLAASISVSYQRFIDFAYIIYGINLGLYFSS